MRTTPSGSISLTHLIVLEVLSSKLSQLVTLEGF